MVPSINQQKTISNTYELGRKAEGAVCAFLLANRYEIVTQNYRKRFGEIDIVALEQVRGEVVLCFVEVRSASKQSPYLRFGIGHRKQARLARAIESYLRSPVAYKWRSGTAKRFDVAWVIGENIEYWKNVELAVHSK